MLIRPFLVFIVIFSLSLVQRVSSEIFFDDWSAFNESAKIGKKGGVLIQINQNGLDFISSVIIATLKKISKGTENGTNEDPKVVLRFLKDSGIGAKVFLPKGILDKDCAIQLLFGIGSGHDGYPTLNVPYCESKSGDVEKGIGSFILMPDSVDNPCSKIAQVINCWSSRGATSCLPNMDFHCKWDPDWRKNASEMWNIQQNRPLSPSLSDSFLEHLHDFSMDSRLLEQPEIARDHLLLQLQGSFLYKNSSSNGTDSTPVIIDALPKSNRMLRQFINAYVWNSLFSHIFHHKFVSYEEKYNMNQLPMVVRVPVESVCWSCRAKIRFELSEPPLIKIDPDGIQVKAKFRIQVKASGILYDSTIISGHGQLNASAMPLIVSNDIRANMTMDDINIEADRGLASYYMPDAFGRSLETWIENRIWPTLSATVQAGFSAVDLRRQCGVHFRNVELDLTDGAVVVGADIAYGF